MGIPQFLFRGDSDKYGTRYLKQKIHHNQLHTNLIGGGDGDKIFKAPLMQLVSDHVLSKFDCSHFLSFTEKSQSAYRFGLGLHEIGESTISDCCRPYYEDDENWAFAILTLNTTKFDTVKVICPGIYECSYYPTLLEFRNLPCATVVLIDGKEALHHQNKDGKFDSTMDYVIDDLEWLLLPANPKKFFSKTQFSAIIDCGCFDDHEKFEIFPEMVKLHNTITY